MLTAGSYCRLPRLLVLFTAVAVTRSVVGAEPTNRPTIDFNRQIQPILSENCFACHGPDAGQRKAKLRLDLKEGALEKRKDGSAAIVPGKAAESELFRRISAAD